jgi:hypothetical protein
VGLGKFKKQIFLDAPLARHKTLKVSFKALQGSHEALNVNCEAAKVSFKS